MLDSALRQNRSKLKSTNKPNVVLYSITFLKTNKTLAYTKQDSKLLTDGTVNTVKLKINLPDSFVGKSSPTDYRLADSSPTVDRKTYRGGGGGCGEAVLQFFCRCCLKAPSLPQDKLKFSNSKQLANSWFDKPNFTNINYCLITVGGNCFQSVLLGFLVLEFLFLFFFTRQVECKFANRKS